MCEKTQPVVQQRFDLRGLFAFAIEGKVDIQYRLISEVIQHGCVQRGGQLPCFQFSEQPAWRRGVKPGAEERQRFTWGVTGDDLMQMMIGNVLIAVCWAVHQGGWGGLRMQWP